ncbi:ATP-dependent Zn protease [Mesorhizobium sp. ZC-5]|uniref:ATP-dependent Zn protease n=1 Tax=Mesorhizobium sp. ZC-5 TaxID=2986066 RepID=UPI0021E71296|nr:ATP-dependent Zn protease [Mesorhizobium sp. ZC-5]MCV3240641.1 ATP-dependent Zn protease [Mesorhizobium sp. ZC-5]
MNAPATDPAAANRVLRYLARRANGMTGADIERVMREARRKARSEKHPLTFADIEAILASSKIARPDHLRFRMAIHEAGHAVARIRLELGEVTMITIDAPEGGFVAGSRDSAYEPTEELLTGILVCTLAGRAAEQELLGPIVACAGDDDTSDLAVATRLAFDMETRLGFARDWPLLYRSTEDRTTILLQNRELAARVNARLDNACDAARELVVRRRPAIEFVAGELLIHDTLEGSQLDAVVTQVRKMVADPP